MTQNATRIVRSSFLATSAALAASAAWPRTAAAQAPLLDLRVAANANDTFAPAYYAQDEGFFTRDGLNVDVQTISNGAAITAAVVGGTIDVGVAVPVTIAAAYLRGLPLVIIAAGAMSVSSVPNTRLCVAGDSTLKTAKDFEGKTLAINALGVGLELAPFVWLTVNGADKSKVKLVELPFSEMGLALQRHTVDAAVFTEPAFTVAAKENHIKMFANVNTAIAPVYVSSCWFTTRPFAQAHPEHVRRFVRAIYDAQKWANAHQDLSAAILTKYSKLDISLTRSMTRARYAEQMRAPDIQPFLDISAKYGGLPAPVSASDLIYQPS
jgi:NitT/TauT family transport system substrate-binding protein